MLTWDKILCEKRIRESNGITEKSGADIIVRNAFEADYDRIVGSSSVRRLQDKAQVYPLQANDITRTRLTHSIEVSAISRSLGKAVGVKMLKNGFEGFDVKMVDKISAILQTAGLVHDLGNPPFGHYGESVIKEWFYTNFYAENAKYNKYLKCPELKEVLRDYRYFDGNVQNFRILTKLQMMNDVFGVNFTYGTLSSIIKYPWSSSLCEKMKKDKYGYFISEENLYSEIRREIGLKENQRNPLVFLLEAADDLVYICDDIEDGVKKGYINWEKEYQLLNDKYKKDDGKKWIFEKIDAVPYIDGLGKNIFDGRVRLFRNNVQSHLFIVAVEEFINNYNDIMTGTFEKELLDREKEFIDDIKEITRRCCYCCHEVLALEAMSNEVLSKLLDIFVGTFLVADKSDINNPRTYAGKLFRLISPNFRYIAKYNYNTGVEVNFEDISKEALIRLAVDFIACMTDSYAMKMYQELTGIKLPSSN